MELFGDRTKEDVRNIHAFLDPILEGALKKKVENLHKDSTVMDGAPTEDGYQVSTLLDDLVSATQGKVTQLPRRARSLTKFSSTRSNNYSG